MNLYIHFPFCKSRCRYCSFYSTVGKEKRIPDYSTALIKELNLRQDTLRESPLNSVYIGGGTPSIVPPLIVKEIIRFIRTTWSVHPDAEISIEVNPESVDSTKLRGYCDAGINRISFGFQAWQKHMLSTMGRFADVDVYEKRIQQARDAGFKNINIDLIFGLPNQTCDQWQESLHKTIAQKPTHISCYSLELTNQSVWGKMSKIGTLQPLPDQLDRKMYAVACKTLKKAGYLHYEISNFALPGYECQHNRDFWQAKPYLGIGAGAASFINGTVFENAPNVEQYIENLNNSNKLPVRSIKKLSKKDLIIYTLLTGLRLTEGVEVEKKYLVKMQDIVSDGFLVYSSGRFMLTAKGRDVESAVLKELIKSVCYGT